MQLLQSELDDVRPQSDRCLGEKSYQGRINDRQPFGVLTTAELLSEVKNATRTRSQRVETYNYQGPVSTAMWWNGVQVLTGFL